MATTDETVAAADAGRAPTTGGPRDAAVLYLAARAILGGVFVSMALAKLAEPVLFLKLVREYEMIPTSMPWLLNGVAIVVPWLELWCGVLLLAGVAVRGTAMISVLMLVVFSGAVLGRALAIHAAGDIAFCDIKFDCGCGGGEVYTCRKLPENAGLVLAGLVVLTSRSRALSLLPSLGGR